MLRSIILQLWIIQTVNLDICLPLNFFKTPCMKKCLIVLLGMAVFAMGCGPSTVIESSWVKPGANTKLSNYKKILIVSFAKDEVTRRQVETELAKQFDGKGVPSYSNPIVAKYGKDTSGIHDALMADGFDGAMVMRLVNKESETSYVPGTVTYPAYRGFRGFYGYGYGMYGTPGYYVEDKIYHIETNFFDLPSNQLLWSAVTGTTNPSKLNKTIEEISYVVAKKMKSDGL